MKKYHLLTALLIVLNGCALGVYDTRTGFEGEVIGSPYPYYETYYPNAYYYGYYGAFYYRPYYRHYYHSPSRYYQGPAYPRHYR